MIGEFVTRLDVVDSTNLFLNKKLKDNSLPEGYLVISNEQTTGRGQFGNSWESAKGMNLTMSFLLYPGFLNIGNQFLLSKFVSLAICDVLLEYVDKVKIKWPNDIYIKDKKVAGVLIENTLRGEFISNTIVGIGLNINQIKFSIALPNPTSLKKETDRNYDIEQLLNELILKLNFWYDELRNGFFQAIDNKYLNSLYRFGEFYQFKDKNEKFIAEITGVEKDGRLCLNDTNNIIRKYAFKEVEYIW